MGVLDAFSKTGPGRPPAIEDVFDADFDTIFGPEPRVTGGRRVNLRDMAAVVQWRQNRRQFAGLADFEMDESLAMLIMETTEAVPVAWKDKKGREFVAIVGDTPVYRLAARKLFENPNVGDPEVYVWSAIVARGGYVPNLPADRGGIDVLRRRNEENKPPE